MPTTDSIAQATPQDLESALKELAQSQSRVEELEKTNRILRQKIDALIRRFFGDRKSDSIDPNQLEMVLMGMSLKQALESETEKSDETPKRPKNQGQAKRRALPEHLETEEIVIEPPEVQANPLDWKRVGQETCEELDWIPSKLIRRLYIRPKYTPVQRPEKIVIAPMPARPIDKGIAGPALLAYIIVSKYVDHLPLHRLEKIFASRFKVAISRKTMADWVEVVANWLKPIYNYLKEQLLKGDYVQVDESQLRYLDRNIRGKSKKGNLWVFSHPKEEVVLFKWNKSRGHEVPLDFLGDFSGTLQCDGFSAYVTLSSKMPGVVLAGCWAHVYRRVREALKHHPTQAGWILRQMQQLYGIEKELREGQADARQRLQARQRDSRPIVQRLHAAFKLMEKRILHGKLLPGSTLGDATTYALGQWKALEEFLDNGQVEIDNNLIENSIRPSAIGKKNYLFIGADEAGWRSATIYSLTETCRRLKIEPLEYLTDVLRRIPSMKNTEIAALAPAQWKKEKLASN